MTASVSWSTTCSKPCTKRRASAAATQVNVHKRVVMDLSEDRSEPRVFINPEFEPLTDQMDQYRKVACRYPASTRTSIVRRRCASRRWTATASPRADRRRLLAVCIQHECDHLNGKLFVDYLSSLKRDRIKKKLEKIHRQQA